MIKIIDSLMGSGKTNWAIQYMNENPHRKFMYITPYNDEIQHRIIPQCPELHFKFAREGHKVSDFKEMLIKGQNIVATHECFKRADAEVESLLEANDYTLILDEVFDVVIDIHTVKADVEIILDKLAKAEDDYLIWTDDTYPDEGGKYSTIKQMAKLKKVLVFDNSFFLWLFPVEFFQRFNEVYIMTFLFPGQIQRYYFDLHQLQYQYYKVIEPKPKKYQLILHDGSISHNLKELIDIYNDEMNNIGKADNALTKTWYSKPHNKSSIKKLKNHIRNFFKDIHNAKYQEIIWTCYKKFEEELKGGGYAKSFVECNCRATNKYKDRTFAAYCVNLHLRPMIKRYVGMDDDQEKIWALSEMLQWLWRSAIREGNKIHLYIPSKRMRELLEGFLDNQQIINYPSLSST